MYTRFMEFFIHTHYFSIYFTAHISTEINRVEAIKSHIVCQKTNVINIPLQIREVQSLEGVTVAATHIGQVYKKTKVAPV